MCGIAGAVSISGRQITDIRARLTRMSDLIAHRGPDSGGMWVNREDSVGFAHRRLAIIDLTENASQPMVSPRRSVISYNGEIYNHKSIRHQLGSNWVFQSNSDTEVVLASYDVYGAKCLHALNGMFSFAIWDELEQSLFAARDRFGIKPFYYTVAEDILYFSSEMKALLPFVKEVAIDYRSLEEYLAFQVTLGSNTLFEDIQELPPAHFLNVRNGEMSIHKYWDMSFEPDYSRSEKDFVDEIRHLTTEAVVKNLTGDVEVGAYVSGGLDSSLVFLLANQHDSSVTKGFHGRFVDYPGFDESVFATSVTTRADSSCAVADITADDFERSISSLIYHLDAPVAGPGAFAQFVVSELASRSVKVVLGGQGGDEIFGGYARYLLSYLEQALGGAIDGTNEDESFVVTLSSIIPNLGLLREYKPLVKKHWSKNLFGSLEQRYFDLLNRTPDFEGSVVDEVFDANRLYTTFLSRFRAPGVVKEESYFDAMTHFDFKNLLPGLLHVEDRVSMAHGLESRVPLLDHNLVDALGKVPAGIKFGGGESKRLLKTAFSDLIPSQVAKRRDKMGFPVPLTEWSARELKTYFLDTLGSAKAQQRDYISSLARESYFISDQRFSRSTWIFLSLELWQQQFHDLAQDWKFK